MPLSKIIAEDQRLRALQILAEDRGYSHNVHVLRSALGMLGHDIRSDQATALVEWLASAGLVEITSEHSPATARLTARGLEVASGRVVVPGVALPL